MREICGAIKRLKSNKGFTLLEVLLSLAILGVLCVAILSAFTTSFNFISQAKHKSNAGYTVQASAEADLNTAVASPSPNALQITIPSSGPINISGQVVTTTTTENGQQVTITYFKPAY